MSPANDTTCPPQSSLKSRLLKAESARPREETSIEVEAILSAVPGSRLEAVLFDVDFTLVRPGPDLGPEGYVRLGAEHGLTLDVSRHDEARLAAFAELERHPELEHDDEIWITFTERIIRGMGGDAERAYACAAEMVAAWEQHDNFELYDDALPVLDELRGRGLKLGLVSNTSRDLEAFVIHHRLEVDVAIGSRSHGKTKPDPTIFRAALDRLDVEPGGGGDGRRLDRGRHRGRARARDARDPPRPRGTLPGARAEDHRTSAS